MKVSPAINKWEMSQPSEISDVSENSPNCDPAQFSSVQSLSHVRLFATPWITARQASLSITNSQSSLKLTSIKSVMPSSHLILCRPFFPSPSQHQPFPMSQLFAWGGHAATIPWWLLRSWGSRRSKVKKEAGLAPDSWGTYERNNFGEPRGFHLPMHRMLNSLIPDIWCSDCLLPLLQTCI